MKHIKTLHFSLVVFFVFLFAGCVPSKVQKPDGSIPDQSVVLQINQDNYWQYLTNADDGKFQEIELEASDYNWDNYLRLCGGLWPRGYVLIDEYDQTISQQTELPAHLNNIKSPEEAIAYIYATNCYLSPEFGRYRQFVNKLDDGYLVSVIAYNFIGCGNHAHRQLNFSLKPTGEWHLLSDIKLEKGEEFCGD